MLKFGKILGAMATLAIIVPSVAFAQASVKVTTTKDAQVQPVTAVVTSDVLKEAPVPTLYRASGLGAQDGQQMGRQMRFGTTQNFGGGMMGGNMMNRSNDCSGDNSRLGRGGMMNQGQGFHRGGSVVGQVFCVLASMITMLLAWAIMGLVAVLLWKKVKALNEADKKKVDVSAK